MDMPSISDFGGCLKNEEEEKKEDRKKEENFEGKKEIKKGNHSEKMIPLFFNSRCEDQPADVVVLSTCSDAISVGGA